MPKVFIDFSAEAKEEFKEEFKKNYGSYYTSTQVQYYSARIGAVLSSALTALSTGLQTAESKPNLQYYLSLTNVFIIFGLSITYGISAAVTASKKAYVKNALSDYPTWFNKPPKVETEEANNSAASFVSNEAKEDRVNALKLHYLKM